jgi:hypothetical protein
MANILTDLAADAYKAADTVGRELVGAIPSSIVNSGAENAAVGQTVRSHFTRPATAVDITPSMTIPEGTDQTVDNKTLTLTKQRGVQVPWTGEDVKFVNAGSGFETIYGDQILQAMRVLANEAEADLCAEIYKNSSRSVGVAGTTPFSSNFDLVADLRKILADNGMPMDNQATIVMDTSAGTELRKLATLQKANEAGGIDLLRQGTLLDLQGLMIKESAGIQSHTAGTATGATTDAAGYAVGDTVITLASAGLNAIVQGDVITFAGDTNQYTVALGDADVSNGGTITLTAPGLQVAIATSATAITVASDRAANIAFHRNAAEIAFRAPAVPAGGDAAVDVLAVQDPVSGLTFNISAYKGYKKTMLEVGAVWGVKAWKPEFIAGLNG